MYCSQCERSTRLCPGLSLMQYRAKAGNVSAGQEQQNKASPPSPRRLRIAVLRFLRAARWPRNASVEVVRYSGRTPTRRHIFGPVQGRLRSPPPWPCSIANRKRPTMSQLQFKVLSPARMPDGTPDPMPVYLGHAAPQDAHAPVVLNGAVVTGGTRRGGAWHGCSYIRPPYVVSGIGEVETLS